MHADYKFPVGSIDRESVTSRLSDQIRGNYCYLDYSSPQQNVPGHQSVHAQQPYMLGPNNPVHGGQVFPYAAAAFAAVGHQQQSYLLNPYQSGNDSPYNNAQNCISAGNDGNSFRVNEFASPAPLFTDYAVPGGNVSPFRYQSHQYAPHDPSAAGGGFMYAAATQPHLHQLYNDFRMRGQLFSTFGRFHRRISNNGAVKKAQGEECKVCGANSSGFHFGVFTCEACKGFFRRYSRKQKYIDPCPRPCEINVSNRNNCPACRFAKCKAVGMAIENIRYGKPPKLACKIARKEYPSVQPADSQILELLKRTANLLENCSCRVDIQRFCQACSDTFNVNLDCGDDSLLDSLLAMFRDEMPLCANPSGGVSFDQKCLLALLTLVEKKAVGFAGANEDVIEPILRLIETCTDDDKKMKETKALFFSNFLCFNSL